LGEIFRTRPDRL